MRPAYSNFWTAFAALPVWQRALIGWCFVVGVAHTASIATRWLEGAPDYCLEAAEYVAGGGLDGVAEQNGVRDLVTMAENCVQSRQPPDDLGE